MPVNLNINNLYRLQRRLTFFQHDRQSSEVAVEKTQPGFGNEEDVKTKSAVFNSPAFFLSKFTCGINPKNF